MKKITILIAFLANFCFGVSLMNYEFFDNSNSVDIVLSFDSAYNPDIYKKIEGDTQTITLKKVRSDEKFTNQINSKILSEFSIIPKQNETEISFSKGKDLSIEALSGNEKLSLTLRVKNPNFNQMQVQNEAENSEVSSGFDKGIIFVIFAVLILLVLAVFVLKILKKNNKKSIDSEWKVFENNDFNGEIKNEVENFRNFNESENFRDENFETENLSSENFENFEPENFQTFENFEKVVENFQDDEIDNAQNSDFKVIYNKKIDEQNHAVVLNFQGDDYLVVLKKSNILPK